MAEFHFLRPWWLVALPVGVLLIWRLFGGGRARGSWYAVVDRVLQPYVLSRPNVVMDRRWPLIAATVGWIAATLALAGPTWERIPVPAYRSNEALVVALDLSRSMDATDVDPSRLARAKLKLLDLLDRRKSGQTGLVVFSANAFTVTPLTTDTHTIAALVGALSTGIMPSHGSYPEAGLTKAGELLRQGGMRRGEILLISDADVSSRTFDEVRKLAGKGYRVDVLAVGTEQGAPIREPGGGFLTDAEGHVVVPGVDLRDLQRLAKAGGGRFARLTADGRDLDALFPRPETAGSIVEPGKSKKERHAAVWRDEGVWLALLLLPLLASGFRRGWLCAWLLLAVLPLPRADAFEWSSLWQRADQRGAQAMQAGHAKRAAKLFKDPQWRAAAQYRSGDYADSATTLSGIETADAEYNRGNALARAGQLQAAVQAYDRALKIDPGYKDARYNRDLVEKLLAKNQRANANKPKSQAQNPQTQRGGGPSGEGQRQASKGGSGGQGQRRQQGNRQADANSAADRAGEQGNAGQNGQRRADDSKSGDSNAAGQQKQAANGAGKSAALAPQDLQKWASQQAADQWLRRIPQDPGGLLRRKFLYQYQRLGVDQDGGYVWPGDQKHPW